MKKIDNGVEKLVTALNMLFTNEDTQVAEQLGKVVYLLTHHGYAG